ncbi:tetratricopeptide repeat protein [Mangrovibacillus cuniculi]|uniref:Tetratricopeptide repeat protein n=1 Tax=Mangrovibacillus cuniculi TaxID=2593652 RepID=A0A7S8HG84_9BACI|nr:hypothetical protein [Mangrovibacillus cuniculi]QPC47734.1 hypothetical protein G8O30_12585 [Mangrovibacillus cuniculi]
MTNIIIVFYVFHTIFLYFWMKRYKKENGVRDWVGVISFFFPIIGEVIFLLLEYLQKRHPNQEGYIPYERFAVNNYQIIQVVSMKERESLPFLSGIQSNDEETGKELVYRLLESDIDKQGHYMKEAVNVSNSETVHYAATGFQLLGRKYEAAIRELTQLVEEHGTEKEYDLLLSVYREYLNSDVLTKEIHQKKKGMYEVWLKQALEKYPNNYTFFRAKGNWMLETNVEDAFSYWENGLKRFPDQVECYSEVAVLYYKNGNIKELHKLLLEVEEKFSPQKRTNELNMLLAIKRGNLYVEENIS